MEQFHLVVLEIGTQLGSIKLRRIFGFFLLLLLINGGCAWLQEPPGLNQPVRDFLVRVKNQRGIAFDRVRKAVKGQGPYDLEVTLVAGWSLLKKEIKEADVLTLGRAWVSVIRPVKPKQARIVFVDSNRNSLAWGLYQAETGLFVDLGVARIR